jgi:organic hydroperoxide reductase OsmC/OhrA
MTLFENAIRCVAGGPAVTTTSGAKETETGPPVEYGGRPDSLNPEELFLASINSCLMLVSHHFAEDSSVAIESYEADAEGAVEKTRNGLRFTRVNVQAQVKAQATDVAGTRQKLAELAGKSCLVSNSVNCPVDYTVRAA